MAAPGCSGNCGIAKHIFNKQRYLHERVTTVLGAKSPQHECTLRAKS
jgi:hypothetical protein